MTTPALPSYSSGTSRVPPARATRSGRTSTDGGAVRRPRGAGRVRHGPPVDLPGARRRGRRLRARAGRPRRAQGRPGRHLGAELRRVGASSSTPPRRSARSWSTSTRPTAATSWPTCSSRPGIRMLVARRTFKTIRLPRRWSTRCAASAPSCARCVLTRRPRVGRAARDRPRGRPRTLLAEREAELLGRRPDQHPVHVGHDRLPEGRDAVAPQHPQQRVLRRRAAAATPRPTGSASRCPSTTASAW